jgi:DNA-directed RNA polymerase subunit alpha
MFSTIKGVKESVLEILLHLKQLKFETTGEGSFMMHLDVKGAGKITGKDISGEAKVVNSDFYIAEITDEKAKIDIDFVVETGVGTLGEDEIQKKESDYVAVEAFFSPVKRVNFKIEEARVGRKSNFDRLVMEVWTDGTTSPTQSIKDASSIISEHFNHLLSGKDNPELKEEQATAASVTKEVDQKLNDIIIDELNLPSRVINALLRENIETVADLVRVGKDKLIGVKGLGKKSFVLIEDELKKMGIDIKSEE